MDNLLFDPRVMSFLLSTADAREPKTEVGGFLVSELSAFPKADDELPSRVDQFHTYTVLGAHQGDPTGRATIFFSFDSKEPYLIVVRHDTGERIRIAFKASDADN